jgi:tetratricopeptide (TPR) repeat protein
VKRPVVLTVAVAALVAAASLAWVEVRQEREFRRLIAAGDAAVAADRTFEGIEAFSGAITLKGDSMLAFLKRGDTYRRREEFGAALRDLRQATSLDPTAPRPIELLGDVSSAVGQYAQAAELYQRYLMLDDRAPAVLYKLGLAQYRAGRSARAIEPLRKALVLNDRLVEAHYLLALALRSQKRHDEALRALERSLEITPTFAAARQELSNLLEDLGRHRAGIEELEALAALEPGRPERLVSVGLAYTRLGRHETAIVTLGRAAERYPASPLVHTALGRAWLNMAESGTEVDSVALGKAVTALAAVASRPGATSEALTLYGKALLMSGNPAGAERAFQQAVTVLPLEPAAFRYLADAATQLGHAAIAQDAEDRYARFSITTTNGWSPGRVRREGRRPGS